MTWVKEPLIFLSPQKIADLVSLAATYSRQGLIFTY
jgi:hypothetical protein